ncbi:MAG: hypothetical protein J6K86_05920 [Clostridia bacterium]|nr:hypothetical protein [Clostridia bacterium]
MEIRVQNTCEELYWETAKKALAECKLAVEEALQLCRSIFRGEEEKALESRYGHLFAPYGEGDVGGKILDRMVALSLPAYGNNLVAIEEMLDDPYHSELNAHYYFQTGRVLAEEYVLPVFDWERYREIREWDGAKAIEMWEAHEEKKRIFFLEIAETLWDFDGFTEKYKELLTEEDVAVYHEYCKKIFIEEHIFLQPQWLLFSCAQWRGKEAFLYENACTDFFLQAHREGISLLPAYALKSRALKELLAKRYKINWN